MTPSETLYRSPCTSPTCRLKSIDSVLVRVEMIEETIKIVDLIRKKMEAQDCQNLMQTCIAGT